MFFRKSQGFLTIFSCAWYQGNFIFKQFMNSELINEFLLFIVIRLIIKYLYGYVQLKENDFKKNTFQKNNRVSLLIFSCSICQQKNIIQKIFVYSLDIYYERQDVVGQGCKKIFFKNFTFQKEKNSIIFFSVLNTPHISNKFLNILVAVSFYHLVALYLLLIKIIM